MNRTCLRCGQRNADASGGADEACPACGALYRKVENFVMENGVLALKKLRSARPQSTATEHSAVAAVASSEKKTWPPLKKAIALVFTVLVLAMVFAAASSPDNSNVSTSADKQTGGALLHCQLAIRRASKNSARAIVPNTHNVFPADADQFAFEWRKGDGLQLQNGFGAMLDSAATCVVARRDLEIDWLTIDDVTVVSRTGK